VFLANLQKKIGSSERGWKIPAAKFLGVSRPTLDRYLKLEAEGRLEKIPRSILRIVGVNDSEDEAGLLDEGKSEVGGSEFDMVNLFAAGLRKLQDDIDRQGHIQSPYPEPLSQAFNLAAAFNIERKTSYPVDLASLIRVATCPVFEWCSAYGDNERGGAFITSRLIEDGEITPDCISMAGLSEADAEQSFYQALMSVCAEFDEDLGQRYYSEWRRAVIENPVAESHAVFIAKYDVLRTNTTITKRLVDFFYERVPEIHAVNGKLALCPLTGTRLKKHGVQWTTEMRDPAVQQYLRDHGPKWIEHTPATIELKRPARVFWALPGWHELQLHKAVQARGFAAILWPDFDSVDLLVSQPSGRRFAVDVKDHISPISLSRTSGEDNRRRRHKRIIVIPDYLEERLPQYKTLFLRARLSSLKEPERVMTVSEFLALLGEKA